MWKVFGTCDDGIWSHSWSPTRRVETWQLPWSSMDSKWECLATSMESHGECVVETWQLPWNPMDCEWRSLAASMMSFGECVVATWQLPWSPMDSEWRSLAASMESHGEVWWKRGSFHGVPWTSQFWMRGWWSDTTAGNGFISGRLRRMVSEVFGKHFGVVYTWSTMSSSFVSCPAWCCIVESQRIRSLFMHLHGSSSPCHICLFAPRFIHMSSMSA